MVDEGTVTRMLKLQRTKAGADTPTGWCVRPYNNFAGDTHCKALWRFESGALTTDSKSTNTLTNDGVDEDTTNHQEGGGCGDWELDNTDYMYRTDANLASGFPLKSGETNKTFSICMWFKIESVGAEWTARRLVCKSDGTLNKISFTIHITHGDAPFGNRLTFLVGYNNGTQYEAVLHDSLLSLATWYHATCSYNDDDKSCAIRIRDSNGNVIGTDATGTFTLDANKISITTADLLVGATLDNGNPADFLDGLIDEMVVFDDVITAAEATLIAKGLYS